MQTLENINYGLAPNDGTGDELRTAFQKASTNFVRIVDGVEAVEGVAAAAGELAADALPAAAKGVAGGVAPLNTQGTIPAEYLPDEFIPMDQKGAANGVATLGTDGKVTPEQLTNAVDAIPLAEKGQPGGVATLDGAGQVPAAQLDMVVLQTEKGAADGVATLDADGILPAAQLPPLSHGQCRFTFVSGTECRLVRVDGDGLIIGGEQFTIPMAGVSVSNTGVAASTVQYVYAKKDSPGVFSLEFSTTGHSTGTNGVEIKTGDPSRTLVGMVYPTSASQFVNSAEEIRVASWFNKKGGAGRSAPAATSGSPAVPTPLSSGIRVLSWSGDVWGVNLNGFVQLVSGSAGTANVAIFVNGVAATGLFGTMTDTVGWQRASMATLAFWAPNEGLYSIVPYGLTQGQAVTFKHELSVVGPI